MILATHALTGAVVGKYVPNVWLVIISAVVLHFVLDTFRHGEYLNQKSAIKETFWKVALDVSVGLTIIFIISNCSNLPLSIVKNMLIGAFFSMFPDFLTFLHWKGKIKLLQKPYELHSWVHLHLPFSPERDWNLQNAANDVIISIIAIILLLI